MIGLVVASPREIPRGFVRATSRHQEETLALPLYRWARTVGGAHGQASPFVAVRTGVGHTRATAGSRLLAQQYPLQALVSFGFAGGLLAGLAPGTLIIGDRVVSEDHGHPLYEANRGLVDQMVRVAQAVRLPVRQGSVVTAERLVPDYPSKAALARKCGASAVDMETGGIAEVAHEAGLAWVAVRAIVDGVDEALPVECLGFLRTDGQVAVGRLVRGIWRSPRMIGDILWLAQRTATARRRLSHLLQQLAKDSAEN